MRVSIRHPSTGTAPGRRHRQLRRDRRFRPYSWSYRSIRPYSWIRPRRHCRRFRWSRPSRTSRRDPADRSPAGSDPAASGRCLLSHRATEPPAAETPSAIGVSARPALNLGGGAGAGLIPADDESGTEADGQNDDATGHGGDRRGSQPGHEIVAGRRFSVGSENFFIRRGGRCPGSERGRRVGGPVVRRCAGRHGSGHCRCFVLCHTDRVGVPVVQELRSCCEIREKPASQDRQLRLFVCVQRTILQAELFLLACS